MALCILLEGFFSGSELAIVSVNRAQLRQLVARGSRRASLLHRVLEKPEWILSTTLIGTSLCTITLNAVATLYVDEHFGGKWEYVTILVTGPLVLLFGEVLPKTLYQRFSDRLAPVLIFPLEVISWVLSPLVATVASIARAGARVTGIHSKKRTPLMTREELELVFQASERHQGVKDFERKMVDRIFSFSDRHAREIMIPLVEVVSVRDDAPLNEAIEVMQRSNFSRIPVFSGKAYNVAGWVNHYDLMFAKNKDDLVKNLMRKVRFVPSTIRLDRLLVLMQKAGDTLAVVVDEYGGAIGIVTLEDVLEEIVGEIEDEHDTHSSDVRRLDANRLIVNPRISITQMNELLTRKIPSGDYETLGGFLQMRLQRIPAKGDELMYRNLLFRIKSASDRVVDEVEIVILKQ